MNSMEKRHHRGASPLIPPPQKKVRGKYMKPMNMDATTAAARTWSYFTEKNATVIVTRIPRARRNTFATDGSVRATSTRVTDRAATVMKILSTNSLFLIWMLLSVIFSLNFFRIIRWSSAHKSHFHICQVRAWEIP